MRYRLRSLVALLILVLAASPASAANLLLHKKTSAAASVAQLDSTIWTLTTGASAAAAARDTLQSVNTDNFISVPPVDTLSDRGAISAGKGFPHNLWLTVEITGATQNVDSLYCYAQFSQGQVPPGTGQTNIFTGASLGDPNSNPANWRWYDAIGLSGSLTGGLSQTVNQTGSATFVFPIPCAASDRNTWLAASNFRLIVVSDTNASAVGISTRAWLTWRTQ